MRSILCAAALFLCQSSAHAKKAPITLTLTKMKQLGEKVEKLKKPTPGMKGKTYLIEEKVLNAYLKELIAKEGKGKEGEIKSGYVHLGDKIFSISTLASVDWKKFFKKGEQDSMAANMLAAIGGSESKIDADLSAVSVKGKALAKILSLKLNEFPVPQSLIENYLEKAGRKRKPPVNYSEPLELPYGIKNFEIRPGKLLLSF